MKRLLERVGLPAQLDVEKRLFALLKATTRAMDAKTAYDRLAEEFQLSHQQRHAGRQNDPDWHWLVRRAKQRLVDAGLMDKSGVRDCWILSALGRNTREWPPRTTLADLGLE
jgi:hypothetical protein